MDDFDVAQLAAYLHLTPDQVARMVERGRLPGRKVQGQWRFSEAEIHHWLEHRIGASDQEELDQVERVLSNREPARDDVPNIEQLCPIEAVAVPLDARTRGSVIRQMCGLAAATARLWDPAAMSEAVRGREELHPTALDSGVALLHPRRPQTSILADSVLALGVCPHPIPFSGSGQPTDVFFLLCSYDDRAHLRILARLSRMIGDDDLLQQLRSAETSAAARQALIEAAKRIEEAAP